MDWDLEEWALSNNILHLAPLFRRLGATTYQSLLRIEERDLQRENVPVLDRRKFISAQRALPRDNSIEVHVNEYDVYICTEKQGDLADLAQALKFQLELLNSDLKVFLDVVGTTHIQKLEEIVRKSATLILIYSPKLLERPFMLAEIRAALTHEKRIVVVYDQRKQSRPSLDPDAPADLQAVFREEPIPYYRDKFQRDTCVQAVMGRIVSRHGEALKPSLSMESSVESVMAISSAVLSDITAAANKPYKREETVSLELPGALPRSQSTTPRMSTGVTVSVRSPRGTAGSATADDGTQLRFPPVSPRAPLSPRANGSMSARSTEPASAPKVHPHSLHFFMRPTYGSSTFKCALCLGTFSGPVYACKRCASYNECPSCFRARDGTETGSQAILINTVNDQLRFHPHPLTSYKDFRDAGREYARSFICDVCGVKSAPPNALYHCNVCNNWDMCNSCYLGQRPPAGRMNRDSMLSRMADNGHYYCGRKNLYQCDQCTGTCGPQEGCNCYACSLLDARAKVPSNGHKKVFL